MVFIQYFLCSLFDAYNYPNTYQLLTKTIHKLKENHINYGAIQTTTKESLQYPTEIIEEYRKKGLDNIFIRPLTPLGYALEKWDVIGYSVDEFIDFYRKCLNTILKINLINHLTHLLI